MRPSTSIEASASCRRGVETPITACRGLRNEERHYRIATAGEMSGPTSITFGESPSLYVVSGSNAEGTSRPQYLSDRTPARKRQRLRVGRPIEVRRTRPGGHVVC
jgi:hypothetical protein